MEAEPLDATGACFPAVRLWMVPRYHLGENTEALRRASLAFRAAHPELDLPLAFTKPDAINEGLPEGQLMIPKELRPRPLPLCGNIYGTWCSIVAECIDSTHSHRAAPSQPICVQCVQC